MAIGGVMNGAVVAAAGAGLAVGDNRFCLATAETNDE